MPAQAGAIKSDISGGKSQSHICDLTVFRDGKLNRELAFLHFSRFGNRLVPVFPNLLHDALQVRAEVDALSIAENIIVTVLAAVCACAQAKAAILTTAADPSCSGRFRCFA